MAKLFNVDVRTINDHLKNIYETEELHMESTIREFRIVQKEGYIGVKEAQELEKEGEELFEAIIMLVASGLIGYFVVWMSNQNRNISQSIKSSVDKTSTGLGLFILAFLSVFREGIELITFILTKVSEKASSIAAGTGIGIVLAILLGYVLFKASVKLNVKIIFKVLGVILLIYFLKEDFKRVFSRK